MENNEILNQAFKLFYDKNIEELRKLSDKENDPQITLLLGRLLYQNKEKWDEAIEIFSNLKDTNRGNVATLYLGRLLIKKGELKKARKQLKTIIDTDLGYAALYEIGRIREFEGNIPGAKGCYFRSLELRKDTYTYYNLGKIFYNDGDYKSAKRMFECGLKLKKDDYYSKFELAKTLIKLEKYDNAESILEELLKVKNDRYVKLELGKIKVAKNEFKEAEKLFRSILSQNHMDHYALHELGLLLYKQKEYKEAKKCFEQVLKITFNFASQYYLGIINRRFGNIKEAKKLLEELIEENKETPGVFHELGRVYFQLGDLSTAKDYFEKSLESKYSENTQIDLAETERFLGNFDRAEELLLECNSEFNKHIVLFQLAMVNIRRGNMELALNMLEESVSLDEKDLVVIRTLVQCYINMNKLKDAKDTIEKYPNIKSCLNIDFLIYLHSKLGIEFEEIKFDNLTYQERQILNYDEETAISYMINMQQNDFMGDAMYSDLDCNKVFEEVKPLLTEKNKFNKLSFGNTYFVKLNSGMIVKVLTLPNNEILKIFPVYDPETQFIDEEDYKNIVKEA